MSRNHIFKFILFFCICWIFSSAGPLAKAQTPTSLSISPAIIEFNIKPGEIASKKITVVNSGSQSLGIAISLNQVTPKEAQGLSVELKKPNWIKLSESNILLASNQNREIEIVVSPHKSTPAGGYYAMLYFQAAIPVNEIKLGSTTAIPRIGALLMINVMGEGTRKFEVIRMPHYPLFASTNFPTTSFAIKNTGNTHIIPKGYIQFNRVGENQQYKQGFSPTLILPSTTREIQVLGLQNPKMGLYKVKVISPYFPQSAQAEDKPNTGYIFIYGNNAKIVYFLPLGPSILVFIFIFKKRKNLKRALKALLIPTTTK
jgi:hypothetical protein